MYAFENFKGNRSKMKPPKRLSNIILKEDINERP